MFLCRSFSWPETKVAAPKSASAQTKAYRDRQEGFMEQQNSITMRRVGSLTLPRVQIYEATKMTQFAEGLNLVGRSWLETASGWRLDSELNLHGFVANDLISLDQGSYPDVTVAVFRSFLDPDDFPDRAYKHFGAAGHFGRKGHSPVEFRTGGKAIFHYLVDSTGKNVTRFSVAGVSFDRYAKHARAGKINASFGTTVGHVPPK